MNKDKPQYRFCPCCGMDLEHKYGELHAEFVKAYFYFHTDILKGVTPRFTGVEGRSIKELVTYFVVLCNKDESKALLAFKTMFNNWDKLPDFWRKVVDINTIAKNIVTIINLLKNGSRTTGNPNYDAYAADLRRRASDIINKQGNK